MKGHFLTGQSKEWAVVPMEEVEEEEEEEVVSYIFIKTSPHKIGVLMSLFLEVAKKIRRTI